MKHMTKTLAVLMSVLLVFTLGISAFAATQSTITVNGALKGETYNLYKIFDATDAGTSEPDGNAPHDTLLSNDYNIAYTISTASPWYSVVANYKNADNVNIFKLTATADPTIYVVEANEVDGNSLYSTAADAAAFAEYLGQNVEGKAVTATQTPAGTATEEDMDATVSFEGMDLGYYFLTTTTGSLFAIDTNNTKVNIKEKNEYPHVDKEIVEGEEKVKENSASIGDVVNYEITVTDGTGTDKVIELHDKMGDGLTYNNDIVITDKNGTVAAANYTVSTDCGDCTFKVVFTAEYVASLDASDEIVLKFSATLNENAVISPAANKNEVELIYNNNYREDDQVKTYTYKFDIVKTIFDGSFLTGAEFKLYSDAECTTEISLIVDTEDGAYRPVVEGETAVANIVVDDNGQATVKGLKAGTYYLKEVVAPDGYNILNEAVTVTLGGAGGNGNIEYTDTNTNNKWDADEGGVQVINYSGNELPATGGMGTRIFYIVGIVCMLGAAVLLITKKRMSAMAVA